MYSNIPIGCHGCRKIVDQHFIALYDLVWKSATPPTHIWERVPKKVVLFFTFPRSCKKSIWEDLPEVHALLCEHIHPCALFIGLDQVGILNSQKCDKIQIPFRKGRVSLQCSAWWRESGRMLTSLWLKRSWQQIEEYFEVDVYDNVYDDDDDDDDDDDGNWMKPGWVWCLHQ